MKPLQALQVALSGSPTFQKNASAGAIKPDRILQAHVVLADRMRKAAAWLQAKEADNRWAPVLRRSADLVAKGIPARVAVLEDLGRSQKLAAMVIPTVEALTIDIFNECVAKSYQKKAAALAQKKAAEGKVKTAGGIMTALRKFAPHAVGHAEFGKTLQQNLNKPGELAPLLGRTHLPDISVNGLHPLDRVRPMDIPISSWGHMLTPSRESMDLARKAISDGYDFANKNNLPFLLNDVQLMSRRDPSVYGIYGSGHGNLGNVEIMDNVSLQRLPRTLSHEIIGHGTQNRYLNLLAEIPTTSLYKHPMLSHFYYGGNFIPTNRNPFYVRMNELRAEDIATTYNLPNSNFFSRWLSKKIPSGYARNNMFPGSFPQWLIGRGDLIRTELPLYNRGNKIDLYKILGHLDEMAESNSIDSVTKLKNIGYQRLLQRIAERTEHMINKRIIS